MKNLNVPKTQKVILAILAFAAIATFVVFYLIPQFEATVATQNIITQFLFYNILIFILIEGILYFIINGKFKSLRLSFAATLILMALDNILPPYAVSSQGFLRASEQIGATGATDYLFAQIGLYFGIHPGTFWLPFFVYTMMSAALLIISLFLIGGNKFLKNLHEAVS